MFFSFSQEKNTISIYFVFIARLIFTILTYLPSFEICIGGNKKTCSFIISNFYIRSVFNKTLIVSTRPFLEAKIRGVFPLLFLTSMSDPFSNKNSTIYSLKRPQVLFMVKISFVEKLCSFYLWFVKFIYHFYI